MILILKKETFLNSIYYLLLFANGWVRYIYCVVSVSTKIKGMPTSASIDIWWLLTVLFTGLATGIALGSFHFFFRKGTSCEKSSGLSSVKSSFGTVRSEKNSSASRPTSAASSSPPLDKKTDAVGISSSSSSSYEDIGEESEESEDEEEKYECLRLKMVFVIRQTTPKLPTAIAAKLVSRAAIHLVEARLEERLSFQQTGRGSSPHDQTTAEWMTWFRWWRRIGCAKITLKGEDNDSTLNGMIDTAKRLELPYAVIDFSEFLVQEEKAAGGKMSLPLREGIAVIALGPAPSKNLDEITGNLKLMS